MNNPKRQRRVWIQIILVIVIGLVVSFLSGDFELNREQVAWDSLEIETILSYLNSGLIIVSLALGLVAIFYLSLRGKED
ncbi:MAG: hypothetical protein P8Y37_13150 [Anaerolineales bacterium]